MPKLNSTHWYYTSPYKKIDEKCKAGYQLDRELYNTCWWPYQGFFITVFNGYQKNKS